MKKKILFDENGKLRAEAKDLMRIFFKKNAERNHKKTLDRKKVCAMIGNDEWGR